MSSSSGSQSLSELAALLGATDLFADQEWQWGNNKYFLNKTTYD